MRLNELTGYKGTALYKAGTELKPGSHEYMSKPDTRRYEKDPMENATNLLKEHGWTLLSDSGFYSRVFGNPKFPYVLKVFVDDPYYKRWLEIVNKNQSNKHFPKLRGKSIRLGEYATAARIERLEPLAGEDDPIFKQYVPPGVKPELNNVVWYVNDQVDAWVTEHQPEWMKALATTTWHTPSRRELDFGVNNFMKRGNTLVITDPYG